MGLVRAFATSHTIWTPHLDFIACQGMAEGWVRTIWTIWVILAPNHLLNALNLVTAFGIGGSGSSFDTHLCTDSSAGGSISLPLLAHISLFSRDTRRLPMKV